METPEVEQLNIPLTVLRLSICVIGILGNVLVIFVILVLAEYKKTVTHWYVLQLAIADAIFLLTVPFSVVEDIEKGWNFPIWICKAKETVLFLNYYSSISFLVVMSIDRYIAVCHGFSNASQKLRTPLAAGIITAAVWLICLLICIPLMIYSTPRGEKPNCRCKYLFPNTLNAANTCVQEGEIRGTRDFDACIQKVEGFQQEACFDPTTTELGSGSGIGISPYDPEDIENIHQILSGMYGSTTIPDDFDISSPPMHLKPGCHYIDFADGFKAFVLFNFVGMFLIPMTIMSVCYFLIIGRLRRTRFRSDSSNRQDSGSETKFRPTSVPNSERKRSKKASSSSKNRVRVTLMCAAMVTVFLLCWLPFHSVHLARFIGIQQSSKYCANLFSAVSLIAFANSAINPYLYNFVGTRFKQRLSTAASAVRESVKCRTTNFSGRVQFHKKLTKENAASNSQMGTMTTRITKGRNDATSADLSATNIFSDASKRNEERRDLFAASRFPNRIEIAPPASSDAPPSYDKYKNESREEMGSKV